MHTSLRACALVPDAQCIKAFIQYPLLGLAVPHRVLQEEVLRLDGDAAGRARIGGSGGWAQSDRELALSTLGLFLSYLTFTTAPPEHLPYVKDRHSGERLRQHISPSYPEDWL